MTVATKPRVSAETATTEAIGITPDTIESIDFNVYDDIFDGLIPFGDEDDRGGGDESCDSLYEECDQTAEYFVMYANPLGKQDNYRKLYFCPRHYAQYLHFILDSMRVNDDMEDLDDEGTRFAIRAYVTGYGPIRNR